MICMRCREGDCAHCLNLGVWHTLPAELPAGWHDIDYVNGLIFKRRDEPTNTWCDCQHEKRPLEETLGADSIQLARHSAGNTRTAVTASTHIGDGDIRGRSDVRMEHAASPESGATSIAQSEVKETDPHSRHSSTSDRQAESE
jgi:hypothetical protein